MKMVLDTNIGIASVHSLQIIEGATQTILDTDVFNPSMKIGITLSEFIEVVGDAILGYPFIDVDNNTVDDTQLFYSVVYQKWYSAVYLKKWGSFRDCVESKMKTLASDLSTGIPSYRDFNISQQLNIDVSFPSSELARKMADLESRGVTDMNVVRDLLAVYNMFVSKLGVETRDIAIKISTPWTGNNQFDYPGAHLYITQRIASQ